MIKTIGIISPASGMMAAYPNRKQRGIDFLKEKNIDIFFAANSLLSVSYYSSSIEQRISDLYQVFQNERIDLVMASVGGHNSNQLLSSIDYNIIHNNNKIICGYSDITALLLALYHKANCKVIYGPTFIPEICEYPSIYDYTWTSFLNVIKAQSFQFTPAPYRYTEYIDWAIEENTPRSKTAVVNTPWHVLCPGEAHGVLMGGNLTTMLDLIDTEYFPLSSLIGSIFFFEDISDNLARIDAMLYALKNRGIFNLVSAIVVGKFTNDSFQATVDKILFDLTSHMNKPVITNVDFGHVKPILSIPIGQSSKLHANINGQIDWQVIYE